MNFYKSTYNSKGYQILSGTYMASSNAVGVFLLGISCIDGTARVVPDGGPD